MENNDDFSITIYEDGGPATLMILGTLFTSVAVGYLTRTAYGCLTFGIILTLIGLGWCMLRYLNKK